MSLALKILGAAEGMALGAALGVDPRALQGAIRTCRAQSLVADNWVDFRPGSHGAVVWEFSYLSPQAGPVRALQWAIPDDSGRRMFVIDMRTSADAWPM